ncbi:MAG: Molybdenum cofactor guanylyltransferase [Phycisphaerae bacterium]|nr:Molybdenum cofactor guanylyltransferase [Phycisphaerae bacterium]
MICAIVLAAGRSRRMGTQKLLLPCGGRTVIGHIVDQILSSPVDRTFVVVAGPDAPRVADALAGMAITLVHNPDPASDMLASVRCGLRALPGECAGVLAVLGDQPRVTAGLIGGMIEAFAQGRGRILVPVSGDRRGHPLLFATDYRQEILTRFDGVGLRGLLEAHADEVVELAAGPAVLDDIDTPDDYRRQLS